jgi:lysophospholipase L1-like esterase
MAVVALAALFIELVSFAAAWVLSTTGLVVADPDADGYEDYLTIRDPVLGWPSPGIFGSGEYDSSGSRLVPAFPDPGLDACVALFGDSFTWGDEVGPEHAYGNVLAGMLDCRVANYGVGGYGTDQAALRYLRVINDDAPVVVLGHFSDNITRNVNQLRDLIAGGRFGLKPRFVIEGGELVEVPLPQLSASQYAAAASRAGELLPYEYFRPGRPGAAGVFSFPFTRAVFNAAMHYRVQSAIRGIRPTYAPFYSPQHPSGALEVTARLLTFSAAVAADRGQRLVVLLIPDLHDLEAARAGEPSSYAPLAAALRATQTPYIDAADYFVAQHGDADFCELFVTCGNSHFNPDGYRLLAEAVYQVIADSR